jgi:GT2 family glycosyltransferase
MKKLSNQVDLSVIIVNYNTKALLKQCLDSVFRSVGVAIKVYVVDNASKDDSVTMVRRDFPLVTVLENRKNLGFSKANNQALRLVKTKYALLLNSDTIVLPETFKVMTDFMESRPELGVSTCRVELPNGKLDRACRRSFPTPARSLWHMLFLAKAFPRSSFFAQYNLTFLPEEGTYEIDCPMGAFFLVRKEAMDQVGLLDEEFFMYGEDIDWAYRFKKAGWKIMYHPATKIIHHKKASWGAKSNPRLVKEFHRAMHIFYHKHYSLVYPRWQTKIVMVGINFRCWGALVLNRFKRG